MKKLEWRSLLKIGISIFLLYLCIHYWPSVSGFIATVFSAATPLLIGLVTAYLINILMSFYERHFFVSSKNKTVSKIRRPLCLIGAVITLAGVISLVIGLVVPQLAACVKMLIDELPGAIEFLIAKLENYKFVSDEIINTLSSIDWKSKIGDIAETLTTGLGSVMDVAISAVTSVFSVVSNAIIGFIFAVYLLLGKDKLFAQIKRLRNRYIPEKKAEKIAYVIGVADDSFHRFIVGQCTEAVILGSLCMIGMLILRLPYAPMIGALIAFTALIPIVGAFIGAGVGAFLILMESPVKALVFLVFIVILQQLEGNLIYPKVVGSSMGLPGIWVLAAVTIGGGVLGIWGMLIGVPVAAVVYRLIKNDVSAKENAEADAAEAEKTTETAKE
ncbi:MAG: AI-2E family transporter [Clostridia bacterium]|nr:AI-2E family transporter [Clostridia bacterium]